MHYLDDNGRYETSLTARTIKDSIRYHLILPITKLTDKSRIDSGSPPLTLEYVVEG